VDSTFNTFQDDFLTHGLYLTGVITWAVEIPVPRIERSRDTRGPSIETIQTMFALRPPLKASL
jgi:hypothetical protein